MAKPVRLAPYSISERLELRLSGFDDPTSSEPLEFEEGPPEDRGAFGDFVQRTYDAIDTKREWKALSFNLHASLPEDELSRVLPSTSDPADDAALLVSVTCKSTKFRHGVRLDWNGDGSWHGDATIRRSDVEGGVRLRPLLVRATAVPARENDDERGGTQEPGMVIGMGDPVSLHVDEHRSIIDTPIDVKWDRFSRSANDWRRDHDSDVYHLVPQGDVPTLWVNEDIGGLRALLGSETDEGPEAALRDTTAVMIAQSVWIQLAVAAFAAVDFDASTGEAELPSGGWQRDVVTTLLPRMYPGNDEDEQLRLLASDFDDPDGVQTLMARAGTAVQDLVRTYRYVEFALRAHETLQEEPEP